MSDLVTVGAAARLLSLHEQTVYRKVKRGEIPSVRLGRTIRIPLLQLQRCGADDHHVGNAGGSGVPVFLHDLFWDVDPGPLQADDFIVLDRILSFGDLPAWRWLYERLGRQRIVEHLSRTDRRALESKTRRFWLMVLNGENEHKDSSQKAESSLGETCWR